MNKSTFAAFLFLIALAPHARAEAPNLLTYQGRLKESGAPVTGTRQVNIFLCDAETGGACTGTGEQPVAVANALFRTTFTVPAAVNLVTGNWYLEVRLGAGGTTTLAPRERLSASPYAVVATSATTLVAGSGQAGVTISTSAFIMNAGSLGVGTAAPLSKLSVVGNASVSGAATFGSSVTVNADIGLTGIVKGNDISARVFNSAATSIAHATVTALGFNSERFDTDSIHDSATNNSRLTAAKAGKYLIEGNINFAANTSGVRYLEIYLNGTTPIAVVQLAPSPAGETTAMTISTLYDLGVGDFVTLRVFQNSGAPLNVTANGNFSPEFMMIRLAGS